MAAELLSVSPSPSKDQDVFGKELRLSEAEQKLLSVAGDIFLSKTVHVDSHSKKGDSTEPRTLVISSSRCYLLIQNPATKLETSFNFLKIRQLQCTENKLTFQLSGEQRPRELLSSRRDSVEIISLITAQLRNVFPKTPLDLFLKLTFDPDSLRNEVTHLRDELTNMMERVDASTIQGFLTAYGFLCDFFGVEFSKEVSWYLNNVYLAHGLREIKLSDFDHLPPKDFLPVISSLRHNNFFEGIIDRDGKLGPTMIEELSQVLNSSPSIKTLVLSNCGLKPESVIHFSNSLKNNPRASLTHLNLGDNALDDRAVEALGSALEALPHGLQQLRLANCKISVKGASALASNMKQNKHMQFSLVHLDLSSNPLGPDLLGALSFIQETQTISTLNLSSCNLLLETVIPLLNRGCTQHLRELDLSNNTGKGKKVVHPPSVASGLQQFCSSSISISSLNLSNCKLSNALVKSLLEGLAVNPNVTAVKLNLSSNDLSGSGTQQMLGVIGRVSCLHHLNLSDCNLDQNMSDIIGVVDQNKELRHLMLGRNFSGKAGARVVAVQQLASMLANENCQLLSLCLEDSHLKEHTTLILEALIDNNSLAKINLSGNQMGSRGARCLAQALLSNCSLSEISWDRNDTPLRGFQEVAAALQQNYTLRVMPLPLYDIGRAGKGVEEHVQSIQQCLSRNHSDERLKIEIAARHRARLLTANQQSSAVGRELVQLEDLLQWVQNHDSSHELVAEGSAVKELANRAIKLTDGLYSPKVESEQFQTITRQVRVVLDQFMEGLFVEHIKEKSEKMVQKSIGICDKLLSEETQQSLQGLMVEEKGVEFTQAKKDVLRHALPEIINHVSDSNVEVAANISELVVEHTLHSLEQVNHKMFKLQKEQQAKNQQAADAKISRNFTFRVQEDNSPTKKKKKRVRRPDPNDDADDEDLIDLPTIALETEGPALQHLGKTRPKPARMQRGRPSKKPSEHPAVTADSTPPISEPATAKVSMKPPPPQVAEKKIKQFLEMKSKGSSENGEVKSSGAELSAGDLTEHAKSRQDDAEKVKNGAEDEVQATGNGDKAEEGSDGRDISKQSSDEASSEESEEHRVVVQQDTTLPDTSSNDEQDKNSTSPTPDDSSHPVNQESVLKTDEMQKHVAESTTVQEPRQTAPPLEEPVVSGSSLKSKGSKKIKSPSDDKTDGKRTSMAEWEIINGNTKASPSPEVIKKPPPAVKEKPRSKAVPDDEEGKKEGKKVPLVPSAQQKGAQSEEDTAPSGAKTQPSQTSEGSSSSPQPTPSPAPAPKPRPKPTVRKKAEATDPKPVEKAEVISNSTPDKGSKSEDSLDTLV